MWRLHYCCYCRYTSTVNPYSNNAYKRPASLVKIDISIQGGAFLMPSQELTIVPVTLHPINESTTGSNPAVTSLHPSCTIKSGNIEFSFSNGVDEHIIQTVMRELKNL